MGTATAITFSTVLVIDKSEMFKVLQQRAPADKSRKFESVQSSLINFKRRVFAFRNSVFERHARALRVALP